MLSRPRRETGSGTMQKIRIDHEKIAASDRGKFPPLIPFVEPCRPDRIVGTGDDRLGSRRKHVLDANGGGRRGGRPPHTLSPPPPGRPPPQKPPPPPPHPPMRGLLTKT